MEYVKVPIFPLTKYMTGAERREIPAPMKPVSFQFGGDTVTVDRVLSCERATSRRVGGRGFRFVCRVSWAPKGHQRQKESEIWFDDFLQEWFVAVPQGRAPVDWATATQISDIGEYYEDGNYLDG